MSGVVEYEWDGLGWVPLFASDVTITPPPPPPPPVNVGPTASFTATATGTTVSFNASSSSDSDGTVETYSWAFGDGSTGSGPIVSHTYAVSGTYGVTLTITDNDGASGTDSRTVTVSAVNASPQASFTYAISNRTVNFTSTSSDTDGTITASAWDFGDTSSSTGIPKWDHILITILENHTATEILNSPSATYIRSLAAGGANFTNSFALTHPSQPNYIQFFSGSAQGVTTDGVVGPFTAPNLYTQINPLGYTFKAYSEDLPSPGYNGASSGNYVRKHAPWQTFSNVPNTTLHVPFTSFPTATNYASLPDVSFVIPNQIHDMHDGGDPERIDLGDQWLQDNLGPYAEWAKTHNSLLLVTFDEDDSSADNKIATIAYGANVKPGNYTQTVDHYSWLGFLLDHYGAARIAGSVGKTAITGPWTVQAASNTATGPTASHTYATVGNYTTKLTVTDDKGSTGTVSRTVALAAASNSTPTAAFTVTNTGLTASVNGSTSTDTDGTITSYSWNWGDGTTAGTGATASHTYTTAGTKTITLTVTDNLGATAQATRTIAVAATNQAPSAAFTATITNLNLSVSGSGSTDPDGTIASYSWTWGDGTANGTGATATHNYALAGTYTVRLTVTDNNGSTGTTTRSVIASNPVPADDPFVFDETEPTVAGYTMVNPAGNNGNGTYTTATVTNVGLGIYGNGSTTNLTKVNGNLTISTNTDVVANYDVTGRIIVSSGVTVGRIENCRVRGATVTSEGTAYLIDTSKAANRVIVRGNDIAALLTPDQYKNHPNGIGTRNFEAYRNWIHHVVDGCNMNTGAGTHADHNAAFYGNFLSDFLVRTPDPQHTNDNKTHADGNECETGFNGTIHGNAYHVYHSTDGTSNVDYTVPNSSGLQLPASSTDAGAQFHPQANTCIIFATWYVRNMSVYKNWFYGGDRQFQIATASAANSTGTIWGNRHERRVVQGNAAIRGPFFNNAYIYLNGCKGFTIGSGSTANVFMDDLDGTTPVPVS